MGYPPMALFPMALLTETGCRLAGSGPTAYPFG